MSFRNMTAPKRSPLSSALLVAMLSTVAPASFAQDAALVNEESPSAGTNTGPVRDLDKVVVTGSRIGRDTFNSVSPIQVITREEATLAGFNSTTGALQSTSVTAGSAQINNAFGGYVTNGGPGANTLSLRGLGTSRTLILLNGRRVSPAGSRGSVGSADLNVLPSSIVDRIEILKDGASSIYGSDAIAGVVNIITRKQFDGVEFEGQYNIPEAGGGEEKRYALTFGFTGDRSYISGSYEYYDRDEITWGDRDWMACQTDYRRVQNRDSSGNITSVGAWGSWDFVDPLTGKPKCYGVTGTGNNGTTINTISTGNMTGVGAPGSVGTTFNRWRPNSAVTTGLVGFEGVGGGANGLNVRDTFDPRMMKQSLISPTQIHTAFAQGGYDLHALGDAELYFETLLHRRESSQTGYRQLSLDYGQGSPLIPANLAAAPRTQSAPTAITNGLPLHIRAFIGFGNSYNSQELDYTKALAGIRGNLPWSDWSYDFSLSHARSEADYTFETWLTDRVAQSLDVVAAPGGGFVCRNTANGCVAAPALSSAVIGGVLPRNWVDWTYVPVTGRTLYKETSANLGVNGSLFSMPFGEARGAFGLEFRKAEIDDTPPIDSQNGNLYNLTSAAVTRGDDSVWEAYGELEMPLLSGITGAQELTANLSARYTDYDSYGSDTTYKIGLLYTPIDWLSVRASYGTSYRAPALFEQFLGATSGFLSSQNDPCNNWGANPDSIRAQNCAAEGLPANFQATQSVQVLTAGGADAGLEAETSNNFTAGIILQPEFPSVVGDISFAVDYYDIEVENGVSRAGAANILSLCYDDPDFRTGGGFCRLIDPRAPGSNALTVHDSYVNLATDIVRGYDFTLRYVRDVGAGSLRATATVTKFLEQSSKLFADDPLDDANGIIGAPEMTGNLDVVYSLKGWKFRYGMDWVDGMSSYDWFGQDPATSSYKMDTPSYITHHLSVQYTADKWSTTAGVRNLGDKEPPMISQGFANRMGNAPLYSGYDYFGRSFFVNVTKKF